MTDWPWRFGILEMSSFESGRAWRDRLRAVEGAGFSTVLWSDHYERSSLGPLAAMAAAAVVTDRLVVGTLVLNNELRSPAMLAKELTTVDLLAAGRLEVEIGAGWMTTD